MNSAGHETTLLGIGGAHIDRIGRVSGDHRPAASNPGRLITTVGGGTLNALRTARLRGVERVALISARGGDADGLQVEEAVADAGIADMSAVFLDRQTATYTAILDQNGDLVTGLADMDLYETALLRQLRRRELRDAIGSAATIMTDANLPVAALETIAGMSAAPLHAIGVSPAKVSRLAPISERIATLFINMRELAALTKADAIPPALTALGKLGFGRAVITDAGRSVTVVDHGKRWTISPPEVKQVTDVTGAGDALAGATVARLALDPDATLVEAVCEGVAAAQMTLRFEGPIARTLTGPEFDSIRGHIGVSETV
ncbi:PfkB family carbohydrate kinase [Oricola cellulosilytica]|uniref:PfkB family carbohydrate kinase n=1 Tax=Oricola cellulosilytica TaxID=1429082 RepID=UPI0013049E36|nr:PfkB family carbohydrate kinase [Oricola cellulosilytica]